MPRTKGSKNCATTSADFDAQIKKLQNTIEFETPGSQCEDTAKGCLKKVFPRLSLRSRS